MVVRTTLSPFIQEQAESAIAQVLRANAESRHVSQGAMIVMTHDGAIRAMVGGRDYDISQFNRATQSLRPPGSSFKPFVFLTALIQGWNTDDLVDDTPIRQGKYRPANFNNEYGGPKVLLEDALAHSLNAATVRLAREVGIDRVIDTAHSLGIEAPLARDLSVALGSSGVPMLEMVRAYAVIANGGYEVEPYAITEVSDADGNLLYKKSRHAAKSVVSNGAVRKLDHMLEKVINEGTGRGAALPFEAAGKTGTSQDHRDAWFIGYTDKYVAAVWVGNDDNSSMTGVTGGSIPARIWRDVMLAAHQSGNERSVSFTPNSDGDGFGSLLQRLFSGHND